MSEWIKKLTEAYGQQQEAMDPVDKSELKGKHKDRKDKDIDNDGDVDSSDEYLHKKRKAISKAQQDEAKVDEISMSKLSKYAKAAKKDIDQKRNTVKLALDQPASVKNAKAGMKAMSGLTKRSRGSDMYVNKITGRSKVKPSMEAYEEVEQLDELSPNTLDNYAKKATMGDKSDSALRKKARAHKTLGNDAEAKRLRDKAKKRSDGFTKAVARSAAQKTGYTGDKGSKLNKAASKMPQSYHKAKPSMEAYEGVPKATHKGYQDPQGVGLSPSAKAQLANKTPTPEPVDEPKVDAKNFKDFRKSLKVSKKRPGDNDKGDKNIVK